MEIVLIFLPFFKVLNISLESEDWVLSRLYEIASALGQIYPVVCMIIRPQGQTTYIAYLSNLGVVHPVNQAELLLYALKDILL